MAQESSRPHNGPLAAPLAARSGLRAPCQRRPGGALPPPGLVGQAGRGQGGVEFDATRRLVCTPGEGRPRGLLGEDVGLAGDPTEKPRTQAPRPELVLLGFGEGRANAPAQSGEVFVWGLLLLLLLFLFLTLAEVRVRGDVVVVPPQGEEAQDAALLVPLILADQPPELLERRALLDLLHAPVVVGEPPPLAVVAPQLELLILEFEVPPNAVHAVSVLDDVGLGAVAPDSARRFAPLPVPRVRRH
mmetsp:Transcript_39931/g.89519  ORF Transcript_39931/g.89519 Transcript_39931/m.89519 type:complete len:245 (+) Transcript_39931:140-874(+)